MTTWIGLQVVNRRTAVRIKILGTNIGKGMTDNLAFEALATAIAKAAIQQSGKHFITDSLSNAEA